MILSASVGQHLLRPYIQLRRCFWTLTLKNHPCIKPTPFSPHHFKRIIPIVIVPGRNKVMDMNLLSNFDPEKEVDRDTTVFIHDNIRQLQIFQGLSWLNFVVWLILANFAYSYLRDAAPNMELPKEKQDVTIYKLFKRLVAFEGRNSLFVALACVFMAYGGVLVVAFMSTRNVHAIILKRGGKRAIVQTPRFIATKHITSVEMPLRNISCVIPRNHDASYVSLKIRGRRFFFFVDKRKGSFPNPYLFDRTIGVQRNV